MEDSFARGAAYYAAIRDPHLWDLSGLFLSLPAFDSAWTTRDLRHYRGELQAAAASIPKISRHESDSNSLHVGQSIHELL